MATQNLKSTITIRTAQTTDIERLSTFIKPFVEDGTLLPRTFDELEEWLPNCFIAETEQGEMVGCAALEIYSKKLGEIRSLAVAPSVQGLGIGKALVQACIDLAQERGVYEIMTITSAEAFFIACGFDYTLPNLKKALFIQTRDIY